MSTPGGGRPVEIVVERDAESAAAAAAACLVEAARAGGHLALAGGSTPRRTYELAASLEPRWGKVELWFGDERCVEPSDLRSNFRLVRDTLLDRLARPPEEVHRIRGELGGEAAAARYAEALATVTLDFALLGIGADGHTASLFPGADAIADERLAVRADGPDVERVTLTPRALNAAATVVFLAVGAEKRDAVASAFGGRPSASTPASLVRGASRTVAILDTASGAGLRS